MRPFAALTATCGRTRFGQGHGHWGRIRDGLRMATSTMQRQTRSSDGCTTDTSSTTRGRTCCSACTLFAVLLAFSWSAVVLVTRFPLWHGRAVWTLRRGVMRRRAVQRLDASFQARLGQLRSVGSLHSDGSCAAQSCERPRRDAHGVVNDNGKSSSAIRFVGIVEAGCPIRCSRLKDRKWQCCLRCCALPLEVTRCTKSSCSTSSAWRRRSSTSCWTTLPCQFLTARANC
jgi:hypothetical protein